MIHPVLHATLISLPLHQTRLNMHRFYFFKSQLYAFHTYLFFTPAPFVDGLAAPAPSCEGRLFGSGLIGHVLVAGAAVVPGAGPQNTKTQSVAQTLRLQMDIILLARTDTGCTTGVRCPTRYELTARAPTDLQGDPQTPTQWLSELTLL